MSKSQEYAALIIEQTYKIFLEGNEPYINAKDLEDPENFNEFLFAILNLVPSNIYSRFTGDTEIDVLGVNYIANRMIAQSSTPEQADDGA